MATYTADRFSGDAGTRPELGFAAGLKCIISRFTVGTALANNDIVRSQPIPKRSTIVDTVVVCSNGAAALNVGIAPVSGAVPTLDVDYFAAAATGPVIRSTAVTARPLSLTSDAVVTVGATGAVASNVTIDISVYFISNEG